MITDNKFHDLKTYLNRIHCLDYAQSHLNDLDLMDTRSLYYLLILMLFPDLSVSFLLSVNLLPATYSIRALYQLNLINSNTPNIRYRHYAKFFITSFGSYLIRKCFPHYKILAIFTLILVILQRIFWTIAIFATVIGMTSIIIKYGSDSQQLLLIILEAFVAMDVVPHIITIMLLFGTFGCHPLCLHFKCLNITKGAFLKLLLNYYLDRSGHGYNFWIPKRILNNSHQQSEMLEHHLFTSKSAFRSWMSNVLPVILPHFLLHYRRI